MAKSWRSRKRSRDPEIEVLHEKWIAYSQTKRDYNINKMVCVNYSFMLESLEGWKSGPSN